MLPYNLEAPHSPKDQDIRLASATPALDDTLFPSEVLSGQFSGVPLCGGVSEDCSHLFFVCPFA